MSTSTDQTARKIADRGREALVERLRPAFEEAAAAHSDVLELSPEQLEEMIQRAADQADGLQWRRALASVATEELGIGLGEALGHPAVVKAQQILEVPSYEEAIGAVASEAPAPEEGHGFATVVGPDAEEAPPEAHPEAGEQAGDLEMGEEEAEPEATHDEPAQEDLPRAQPEPDAEDHIDLAEGEEVAEADEVEPGVLKLPAIHLGGIADLEPSESGIELRLSEDGLDIARQGEPILGRLTWRDLRALDVSAAGRLRRRGRDAHLVVRAAQGDASFRIAEMDPDQLRDRLRPFYRRL